MEGVREDVTPTGNQRLRSHDPISERARRIMRSIMRNEEPRGAKGEGGEGGGA